MIKLTDKKRTCTLVLTDEILKARVHTSKLLIQNFIATITESITLAVYDDIYTIAFSKYGNISLMYDGTHCGTSNPAGMATTVYQIWLDAWDSVK